MSDGPLKRSARWALALFAARRSPRSPERVPDPPPSRASTIARGTGGGRAELVVAALLAAAAAFAAAFAVLYVLFPDTQLLGIAIGVSLLSFGVALALAGKRVVPREKASAAYEEHRSEPELIATERTIRAGRDGVSRRRLLIGAGGAAAGAVGAAALVPLASLGPEAAGPLFDTPWRAGRRLVGPDDEVLLAADVEPGTFLNGFPEGAEKSTIGAPLIVVRLSPEELELPAERRAGAPDGILAFSKICPHAGCAVSMYRHPLYEPTAPAPALVCPCHYSTFDPRRGGALEFGPAGRDLPQLPLRVDADGALAAAGDFYDPPGPSYGDVRRRDEERS